MELIDHWDSLYDSAHERGLKKIHSINGVACAFHSVIDGYIRLTPEIIEPLLKDNPSFKQAAKEGCVGKAPPEILTPEDFIEGMFYSVFRGSALQRMIRSEETYQWVLETFGPGELRLGGTSGNMARALAPLNIPVTVYANPLTQELAELFGEHKTLSVIQKNGANFELQNPQQAANEEGIFAIHWIFEYGTDFQMMLDGKRIHPNRANRYIPSWNPRNNQFRMSPQFQEGFLSLIDQYQYLLFSGFHILSESYPDGSTCYDVVRPLGEYIQSVRQKKQNLKIHLEMASIGSLAVRKAVYEYILPHVHSLGLNETELPLLIDSFGPDVVEDILGDAPTSHEYAEACSLILDKTKIERVHFHNLGYYLCVEREPWNSPEDSRNALLFAATMAAARAQNGLFTSPDDIKEGLSTAVGVLGINEISHLSHELQQPSIVHEGVGKINRYHLAAIPTKLVEKPLFTVGLGDTISSGALLTA